MNSAKWFIQILILGSLTSACTGAASQTASPQMTEAPIPVTQTAGATASAYLPVATPSLTNAPAGAWITLSPNLGKPGTIIQIDGYFAGAPSEQELTNNNYITHGDVCWGDCQDGLIEEGVEVTWSATELSHFSLQVVVPSAPWLAFDGLHPLQPGDYTIAIKTLDLSSEECPSGKGCLVVPLASAPFHLSSGYSGPGCQGQSCGTLHFLPSEGAPGTSIQITGWAPLLDIIGQPVGYDLMLETKTETPSYQNLIDLGTVQQGMDGSLIATFQVPQYDENGSPINPGTYTLALNAINLTPVKGGPPVLIAPASFKITAAASWLGRKRGAPLWIQPAGSIVETLSVDPSNPRRFAYCEAGAIRYTQDGGRSWVSIPTGAVKGLSPANGIRMGNQGAEQLYCSSVTLDSTHPDSFYAVFSAVDEKNGPPPIYFVGCYTTDHGNTWQLVPVPSIQTALSATLGNFGGFWADGKVVRVLYSGKAASPVLAEQTADGGVTWKPASLTCPSSGPCLSWGPAPGAIYGMAPDLLQAVMASYDSGRTWEPTGESAELRQGGPYQLVALSQNEALLINGSPPNPILYTPDGGRTWQTMALPPLPAVSSGLAGYPGLQMFPDESLLAMNPDTNVWWVLPPNAQGWCALKIISLDNNTSLLQVIGDRVWWLSVTGESESAPRSSFFCQQ